MKFGAMFVDVLRSVFTRPATRLYPKVRTKAPARLHGKLYWDPKLCTGCTLCVKDCPADAIELITIDRATKHFVMRYHADRCTYCAQCVVSCRFKCLGMSNEGWELAALKKEAFTVEYGSEADLAKLFAVEHPGEGIPPAGEKPASALE